MAQTATNPDTGEQVIFDGQEWKPYKEEDFQRWYFQMARETGINENPDDPQQKYDYRSAYAADATPLDDPGGQWPSQFKAPDHPDRYINGIDTITDKPAKTATNPETGERFYYHEGLNEWKPFVQEVEPAGRSVWGKAKLAGRGLAQGLTTELPKMAGQAAQFVGERIKNVPADVPAGGVIDTRFAMRQRGLDLEDTPEKSELLEKTGDIIGGAGKAVADWADEKSAEWYGDNPKDLTYIDNAIFEGSKMLAPSIIPGATISVGSRILLGVGNTVKAAKAAKSAGDIAKAGRLMGEANKAAKLALNAASAGTASLFGLSQAQQTVETANARADELEKSGDIEAAAEMRKKAQGIAPLVTGGIEATGEFFGTKYLGQLFGLSSAEVLTRGARGLLTNFFKTLGVEVGTELGQAGGQAVVEKYTAIRPEANPFAEALSVVGPTVFMTILTGGLGAAAQGAQKKPNQHDEVDLLDAGEKSPPATPTPIPAALVDTESQPLFAPQTEEEQDAMQADIKRQQRGEPAPTQTIEEQRADGVDLLKPAQRANQAEIERIGEQDRSISLYESGLIAPVQPVGGGVNADKQKREISQRREVQGRGLVQPLFYPHTEDEGMGMQREIEQQQAVSRGLSIPETPYEPESIGDYWKRIGRERDLDYEAEEEAITAAQKKQGGLGLEAYADVDEQVQEADRFEKGMIEENTAAEEFQEQKTIDGKAHEAATSPKNDLPEPTDKQKEAGVYKKGHLRWNGLEISVENPEGSTRREKRPEDAPEDWKPSWETEMKNAHYGYVRGGKEGKDGDPIDVFLKPGNDGKSGKIFVIDQTDPISGKLDEHKVMMGYGSEKEAGDAYLSNYEDGWQGLGAITPMAVRQFKKWLETGDHKKSVGYIKPKIEPVGEAKIDDLDAQIAAAQKEDEKEKAKSQKLLDSNREALKDLPVKIDALGYEGSNVTAGKMSVTFTDGKPDTISVSSDPVKARAEIEKRMEGRGSREAKAMGAEKGKEPKDPHVLIERRVREKYKDITGESTRGIVGGIYTAIDGGIPPAGLDKILKRIDNTEKQKVLNNLRSIIGDQVGELIETHKYEGHKDGSQFEAYLDALLGVIKKHELSANRVPDKLPEAKAARGQGGRLPNHPRITTPESAPAPPPKQSPKPEVEPKPKEAVAVAKAKTIAEPTPAPKSKESAKSPKAPEKKDKRPETIIDPAIRLPNGDIVSLPYSEGGHISVENKLTKAQKQMLPDAEDGVVTDSGRFLTRDDAVMGTNRNSDQIDMLDLQGARWFKDRAIDRGWKEPSKPSKPSKPSRAQRRTKPIEEVKNLRAAIRKLGGISFGNFKGELNEMPHVKIARLSKRTGVPIDLAEEQLRDAGFIGKAENLLEVLRNPDNLLRKRLDISVLDQKESDLTDGEKKLKQEIVHAPEGPPGEPKNYKQIRAEDLPEGKKLTLIDKSGEWDVYEVIEKNPFEITIQDGKTITLAPHDTVEVLKPDVGRERPKLDLKGEKEISTAIARLNRQKRETPKATQETLTTAFETAKDKGTKGLRLTGEKATKRESNSFMANQGGQVGKEELSIGQKAKGIKASGLESSFKDVVDSWMRGPELIVVQKQSELPKRIQTSAQDRTPGKSPTIRGAFSRNRAYLVADNFDSVQDAAKTLVHEVFGHQGIKATLGRPGRKIFSDIYAAKKGEVSEVAKQYNLDLKDPKQRDKAVEEWLARQAEKSPKDRFVERVIAAIKRFLRKAGFAVEFSDAEIRQLLVKARDFVVRGKQKIKIFGYGSEFQYGEWKQPLKTYQDYIAENPDADIDQIVNDTGLTQYKVEQLQALMDENAVDDGITTTILAEEQPELNLFIPESGVAKADTTELDERLGTLDDPTAAGRIFDEFVFQAQDRFNYLNKEQMEASRRRRLAGLSEELPENMDSYLAELRYHGMTGAETEDFQEEFVQPLIELISENRLEVPDIDRYLHARHAPEANARLKKINLTQVDIDKKISELSSRRDEITAKKKDIRKSNPDKYPVNQTYRKLQKKHDEINSQISRLKDFNPVKNNEALSGMTDEQAAEVIAKVHNSGKEKVYQEIAKIVDLITKRDRENRIKYGLEKAETVGKWKSAYKYYVPLMREGKELKLPPKGKGYDVRGGQKMRGGSQRSVVNVLAYTIAQAESAIVRGEKNKVSKALYNFATDNEGPWKADKVEYVATFDSQGLVQHKPDPSYRTADNVVNLRIKGVDHHITFDPQNHNAVRIAQAMKKLKTGDSGPIVSIMSHFTRWLALVNTGLNPEFIISNFLRDLQTAGYNMSDSEAAAIKWTAIKEVGKAWNGIRQFQKGNKDTEWAKWFDKFRKAGAKTGWISSHENIEKREKDLVKQVKQMGPGAGRKFRRGLSAIYDFINDENTAVENGIRLSVFKNLVENGVPEAKSARIVKELTVNFNRKGNAGQAINAAYLFYNASIQGSARVIAAGVKSPKVRKLMLATIIFAAANDILQRTLGGDDDDGVPRYDKVPDWVKERNLVVMLPSGYGYIKIPLPWGYNVFHVMGQAIGEIITKKNNTVGDSALRVAAATVQAFNPIGGEATFLQFIAPSIFRPVVQWSQNKDWTGRPLRPNENPFMPLPDSQRYFRSVREPSKAVADQLNKLTGGSKIRPGKVDISPEAIDLFIDTFTGGAGRFASDSISTPLKVVKGETIEPYEVPLLRKVYGKSGSAQLFQEFYKNIDAVRLTHNEIKAFQGDSKKLMEIKSKYGKEAKLIPYMQETQKAMRIYRSLHKKMELSPDSKKRRASLKKIGNNMNELMKEFNKKYNKIMGD